MWVIGGSVGATYHNDVWHSTDGATWTQATANAAWSARSGHSSVVYDNKMWVMGGYDGGSNNDVWYSSDGVNWTEATDPVNGAAWPVRTYHGSVVYENKIWVMGGAVRSNDVWHTSN